MGDSSADLVILATPPSTHAPLAVELLRAGKHVLVETPLCLSLAEADMILDAARQANRSIICAQTRRWDDDFQTVLRTVAGGTLGKPRIVKYVNWHFGPARHDSSDWRGDPLSGGGPMWEFGVHLFDQLLQLAGEFPREVFTVLPPAAGRRVDVEAGFLSLVRFPSGLMSQIEVHCETPVPFQTGWIVVGSEGSCQGGTQFTVTAEGEVVDEPLGPIAGGPDDFYAAVARHLREGEPNPVGAEEARRTISVLVAARQSAQTGRPAPVEA